MLILNESISRDMSTLTTISKQEFPSLRATQVVVISTSLPTCMEDENLRYFSLQTTGVLQLSSRSLQCGITSLQEATWSNVTLIKISIYYCYCFVLCCILNPLKTNKILIQGKIVGPNMSLLEFHCWRKKWVNYFRMIWFNRGPQNKFRWSSPLELL
jgi:hypothetical protein